MKVRVRFFAELRERTGCSEWNIDLPEKVSMQELWGHIRGQFEALQSLGYRPLPVRNGAYTTWDQALEEGDELAFLSPVGGG